MEDRPQGKLDPRIKAVWRISDAIWITIVFLCVLAVGAIAWFADETTHDWSGLLCLVSLIVYAVALVVFMAGVTPLRYVRWHYALRPEFLEIEKGIIWRSHTVVPFIRVQNTDTQQGPILRLFGLASVTVSTAAGSMEIPGLASPEADAVRDRAAELARIAREDV